MPPERSMKRRSDSAAFRLVVGSRRGYGQDVCHNDGNVLLSERRRACDWALCAPHLEGPNKSSATLCRCHTSPQTNKAAIGIQGRCSCPRHNSYLAGW